MTLPAENQQRQQEEIMSESREPTNRERELQAALDDVLEVAIWLTGLAEFPEGSAWPEMKERLHSAMSVSDVWRVGESSVA